MDNQVSFLVTFDVTKPLSTEEIIQLRHNFFYRIMGYQTTTPDFITGDLYIEYIKNASQLLEQNQENS